MSYTKHTWTDGELVTATKMNNIENGIEEASSGGGVLVVHAVSDDKSGTYTLDKTWQECNDAKLVSIVMNGVNMFCLRVFESENVVTHEPAYRCVFYNLEDQSIVLFNSSTASGYPSAAKE